MREQVLITVTGADRPGIVAELAGVLARTGAGLVDVEQVVVQQRLTLGLLVEALSNGAREELGVAAARLGVELTFEPVEEAERKALRRYVVTAIGGSIGAGELQAIATELAQHGANVERITRLSRQQLIALEIVVALPAETAPEALKHALLGLGVRSAFDVALQREGLFRRSKRLVVMDMDSTLIRIEVIDELARAAGVVDRVSAITERAMRGEMDYDESLRQRLALLKGLDVAVLEKIAANLPLTEGAETLVKVLRRLGYRTAVLSGGFSIAAQALKARLGLDEAFSNVLEIEHGKLTGRVVGPIVNGARKAQLLEEIARREGILLDQVIAIGDGANDLPMLERAGLGVAFHAKPKVQKAAHGAISASGLDAILFLLGIRGDEIDLLLQS
jgi:phosphoserine phosphatase